MSDDPTYRKARAALREAQAQAQIAMSELRLRGEFYHELAEAKQLLEVVYAELVVSLPAVRAHLDLLDAANDASHAGMRPYVSIEDEGLKPGGMVPSLGKSVIIDGGDEEYLVPEATLKWWQTRDRAHFSVYQVPEGLCTQERVCITHTPTGQRAEATDFWTAVHLLRAKLEQS